MPKATKDFRQQLVDEMNASELPILKRPSPGLASGGCWCKFLAMDDEFEAFECEALVFGIGSRFGINGGRVSKLTVRNAETREELYHFDRNSEWGEAPAGLLDGIAGTFKA